LKPVLALLLAAACTMSYAQTPTPQQARKAALTEEIRAGTAVADHRITLDGYEWEIYVDRSFNPPVVVPAYTTESLNRLLSLKSVRKQKALMLTGKIKALNYARAMRGEPQEAVPTKAQTDKMFADFEDEGEPAPLDTGRIRECPERFRPEDSNRAHFFPGGMILSVDEQGRPNGSYMDVPDVVVPSKRNEDCQTKVSELYGSKPTDQGGHAIGARLGGWPKRANLTPQDGVLNMSYEWKQIDATVDLCAFHGYSPQYAVNPHYEAFNYDSNRPQLYDVSLAVYVPGVCPPPKKYNDIAIMNRNPTQDDKAAMQYFTDIFKGICKVPGEPCKP
jgi:hypothetical protein